MEMDGLDSPAWRILYIIFTDEECNNERERECHPGAKTLRFKDQQKRYLVCNVRVNATPFPLCYN